MTRASSFSSKAVSDCWKIYSIITNDTTVTPTACQHFHWNSWQPAVSHQAFVIKTDTHKCLLSFHICQFRASLGNLILFLSNYLIIQERKSTYKVAWEAGQWHSGWCCCFTARRSSVQTPVLARWSPLHGVVCTPLHACAPFKDSASPPQSKIMLKCFSRASGDVKLPVGVSGHVSVSALWLTGD